MNPLDKLVGEINKRYGGGTLLKASEAKSLVVDRLPSGVFDFDMKTGGGFPRGRITQLKGEFSTGKTALCLLAAAQAQRHCRLCGGRFEFIDMLGEVHEEKCKCGKKVPMRVVWLDAEHAFEASWAAKWGVDPASIYVIQAEYAEQAIDVVDACIRSGECDLLIVDSVAALTPSIEVEESAEKQQMGVFARLMNKALRKWTSAMNAQGLLAETKCTVILINQLRLSIGGYKPSLTSPGGKGLDFFASVDVRLKKVGEIMTEGSDRPVGIDLEFVVKKNKTAPLMPGGKFKLFFVSEAGSYRVGDSDNDEQVLRAGAYWKLIPRNGSWYTFPDGNKVNSAAKAAITLRQDPALMAKLEDGIRLRELAWANEGYVKDVEDPEATHAE